MSPPRTYERLLRTVFPWIQDGEFEHAIDRCEAELEFMSRTEYHDAVGRSWLGQTSEAARWLAGFYEDARKEMSVRAIYCEMNRFEINPIQWYVSAFAYDYFGKPDAPDWLTGWKKISSKPLVLRGMSDLQDLFARDYRSVPPRRVRTASEIVILLLTLRMHELIQVAARKARQTGRLPQDIPVLSAAHDAEVVCHHGEVIPPITLAEPAQPIHRLPRAGSRPAIFRIDGGFDQFGASLPWDVLDYKNERDDRRLTLKLDFAKPLASRWKPPHVKLRQRDWRCDLISLYPHWALNERARAALGPLLRKTVEFLPLRCDDLPQIWVMHSLRHVLLGPDAEHNALPGNPMTVIRRYDFETSELQGKHLFGVSQTDGSPYCFAANYVSDEFKRVVIGNELKGVVFDKVFTYPKSRPSA